MHELSIAVRLVDLASEAARDAGPIEAVRVRVGTLSGVVVEALEFAWEAAREDTPCADAALIVERVPARLRCPACGCESACEEFLACLCERCGGPAEVSGGRELDLMAIECSREGVETGRRT